MGLGRREDLLPLFKGTLSPLTERAFPFFVMRTKDYSIFRLGGEWL